MRLKFNIFQALFNSTNIHRIDKIMNKQRQWLSTEFLSNLLKKLSSSFFKKKAKRTYKGLHNH